MADGQVRSYRADGQIWIVQEHDCRGQPGARGDRCLTFAGDCAWRRVWTYPANWAMMSDEELERLSRGT